MQQEMFGNRDQPRWVTRRFGQIWLVWPFDPVQPNMDNRPTGRSQRTSELSVTFFEVAVRDVLLAKFGEVLGFLDELSIVRLVREPPLTDLDTDANSIDDLVVEIVICQDAECTDPGFESLTASLEVYRQRLTMKIPV
ncbi:hypothetical protein ACFC06_25170 [Nocardia sp. NPDC056064]|uniref:hypothetical protein n=1 Tax=Nocardia sp. NPDC056064 TaxID=3345701 RepID=UPI0035D9A05D